MAARGRKESSCVASLLWLAWIFLVLWGPRPASADGSPLEEAKEKAENWANWVQDKVTEGLGLRHENARMAAEQIKDAAGNAASKISSAASDTAKYATASLTTEGMNNRDDNKQNVHLNSKGGSSAQVECLKMDKMFMQQTAETGGKSPIPDEKLMAILKEQSPISNEKLMAILKETTLTEEKLMAILKAESPTNSKLEETKVSAMLKAEAAKAKIKDGANMAADKAEKAYEGAKEKVKETYETAKDTLTESAKANYEAAKEKASQATGDLGAMMQQKTAGEL
ncbi:late embryogenesis abundant protein D-29-like [Cocos nucifera]|uniref:Late embryogenesis abundant protein D-29-like n=1 Tax=Cocos nucifera TaxID=13894 RepID=A0A8K0IBF0_COCNU|nr:late embryogenesis abundant protein D-29-like [Cocos nucifera]